MKTENEKVKKILLTQGKVAFVDEEDYEKLIKNKWYTEKNKLGTIYYARRNTKIGNKRISIFMHREILGLTYSDGKLVDHKNWNGLDNRKENLRIATRNINAWNTKKLYSNNTSGFRGLSKHLRPSGWQARIRINGKTKSLGYYKNPEDAAFAYDQAALKYRGSNAILNFPL